MLTTSQTRLVAASTPDEIVCLDCAMFIASKDTGEDVDTTGELRVWLACNADEGYRPIIEYDLESYEDEGYGLYCVCGAELIAPSCSECGREFTDENRTLDGEDEYGQLICNNCVEEQKA